MSIDKQTLDYLLQSWAFFHIKEFESTGYASKSVTAKACEAMEAGITSHGTKHLEPDFDMPEYIRIVSEALLQLSHGQRAVIREEYTGRGNQHRKARSLQLTTGMYKARLFRARVNLMQLL